MRSSMRRIARPLRRGGSNGASILSTSMPRHDETLHGKQQRLNPEHDRVHHAYRVYDVEVEPPRGAHVLLGVEDVMIVGVGVGDAVAAGRDAFEPPLVERFQIDGERS